MLQFGAREARVEFGGFGDVLCELFDLVLARARAGVACERAREQGHERARHGVGEAWSGEGVEGKAMEDKAVQDEGRDDEGKSASRLRPLLALSLLPPHPFPSLTHPPSSSRTAQSSDCGPTLCNRVRTYDRTRNFARSISVCTSTSRKCSSSDVAGSALSVAIILPWG